VRQLIFILFLTFVSTQYAIAAPTLWSFDGPLAIELQSYLQKNYVQQSHNHLFDEKSIHNYIAQHKTLSFDKAWSCLSNQSKCNLRHVLFNTLGIKQRIFAYAEVNGMIHKIHFMVDRKQGKLIHYRVEGKDLASACASILNQLLELGAVEIKVHPPQAKVWIDGKKITSKAGKIPLSSGSHEIIIKSKGYQTYQESIEVKGNYVERYDIRLKSLLADFKLLISEANENSDFKVLLDKKPILFNQVIKIPVGEHQIKVTASDYKMFTRKFSINYGEKLTLKAAMNPKRARWKVALKTAHPDVKATHNQVYFRLRAGQLHSGAWSASVKNTNSNPLLQVTEAQAQSYPTSLWGFDLGFQWNLSSRSLLGPLRSDLIGLSYQSIGRESTIFGKNSQTGKEVSYDLIEMQRFQTRFAWIGYQFPMWRITPYFDTGFIWVYESAVLQTGEIQAEISQHTLRWGWEAGIDFTFSPKWVLKTAMLIDTWPGERTALQAILGVAYAFNALRDPF
jgi:hypothetical protein